MNSEKARWKYRFDNFKKAYFLLQEAVDKVETLDQLSQEGLIQRFEFCTELAWKTIKDYLESQNMIFKQITPRSVLKEAIAVNFLSQGQAWLNMLDTRNKMSHTYDFSDFENAIEKITQSYIFCYGKLYENLLEKYLE